MAFLSSGNWNNSSNAGVWYANLNNNRTNSNNNIGFRSDSGSPRIRQRNGGTKGDAFRHAAVAAGELAAKSVCHRHSGRRHVAFEGLTP